MADRSAQQERHEASGGHNGSWAMKTAGSAVVTGAATYAIARRMIRRNSTNRDQRGSDKTDKRESDAGNGVLAKKDELTEAISTKAAELKEAAGKLRPKRQSSLTGAVPKSLLPLAGEAAAAVGKVAAEKAPDVVRKEIIPRFIDGFKRAR
jgi:hypothetical protein